MDRAVSSYLNGVSVKISEKYRPPPRPTLPPGLCHFDPAPHLFADNMEDYNESGALELVANMRSRRAEERAARRQRISQLDNGLEDEKEKEEVREDVSQTAVPGNILHPTVSNVPQLLPNGTPLLPVTAQPMPVLTPIQSSAIEMTRKADNPSVINLSEFEGFSTNPFEEMELKTLNDKEELALLLQPAVQHQSAAPTYGAHHQAPSMVWPPGIPQSYQPAPQYSTASWMPSESLPFSQLALEQRLNSVALGNGSVPKTSYTVPLSHGSLRQAKSVPDLSETGYNTDGLAHPEVDVLSSAEKRLSSRTPPPRLSSDKATSAVTRMPKPILSHQPSEWENKLNATERRLLHQLSDMGFPRDRCARVITRLGANEKDVVDQLVLIQTFQDVGHPIERVETALDMLKPGKDLPVLLEQHLKLLNQLIALGFDPKKISAALVASGHDRDKALDILLVM